MWLVGGEWVHESSEACCVCASRGDAIQYAQREKWEICNKPRIK